jgi:hypothetical protein
LIHCCLCQWTEFSSGRFCGLSEWLSDCNDLRPLCLSSAEDRWLTGCTNTALQEQMAWWSSSRNASFLPEMHHLMFMCTRWYSPLLSAGF